LSLYLDGDLPPRKKRSLEEHMQRCPHCQRVLKDLEAIRKESQSLERFTPPEGLWEAIEHRLELRQPGQRKAYQWLIPPFTLLRRGWALRGVIIAAAVVVAVFALLRLFPLWTPAEEGVYPFSPALMAEVRQQLISARAPFVELISELSRLAEGELGGMDPSTARAFRESLQGIDWSIELCEEEMERYPFDSDLRGHLFNVYQEKLALLEFIIEEGGTDWSI